MMTTSRRMADERGTTLVEVLIAMIMLSIVLAVTSTGLITMLKTQRSAESRTLTQSQNRTGVEFATRLLREATYGEKLDFTNSTVISAAGPDRVVFYSRLGNAAGPSTRIVLEYFPAAGELRWGQSSPTCSSSICTYATPVANRVLVRYVRNGVSSPCVAANPDGAVFRFFTSGTTAVSPGVVLLPVATDGAGQVQGVNLKDITSVEMELWTDEVPGKPAPDCESLSTTTSLRNRRG